MSDEFAAGLLAIGLVLFILAVFMLPHYLGDIGSLIVVGFCLFGFVSGAYAVSLEFIQKVRGKRQ